VQTWRKRLPHPALVFVVLAWGLNFSVIKIAYKDVAPASVGLFRYLWMLPLLGLWCVATGQSLKYPKGLFWRLNLAGFVGSGAYMVVFLEGMRTTPPTLASIALATAPVMTTFLSVLFKQDKFTWRLLVGSLIAFSGVAISVADGSSQTNGSVFGTLLIVCSAVFWACSIVLYRPMLAQLSAVRVLTLSFPGAMLVLVPYGFHSFVTTEWSQVTVNGWTALAYLVLVAGVGAFAAYYKGLSDVGPARSSMTQYFVPPVAALFSALVLHQMVTANEIIGLIVVVIGVLVTAQKSRSVTATESS